MGRPRAWTDDQLRAAVAASTSMKEAVERLRDHAGAASYATVRSRVELLSIDTSHFTRTRRVTRQPRPGATEPGSRRGWTDDDLRAAVAASTSLKGVFDALELRVGGSQWQLVRALIRDLALDTSHWDRRVIVEQRRRRIADRELADAVPGATSFAEVMRRLGLPPGGRLQRRLQDRVAEMGLDTSAMLGRGWSRGRTDPPGGRKPLPLADMLVADRPTQTSHLRRRLLREGVLPHRCASCELATWLDEPIPLELDHVNGDRNDNRLENLRLLCPNCHARTETYRGRNVGRYDPPSVR